MVPPPFINSSTNSKSIKSQVVTGSHSGRKLCAVRHAAAKIGVVKQVAGDHVYGLKLMLVLHYC